MPESTTPQYIEVTQAFLRFYVLATQYLDHGLGTHPPDFLTQAEVHTHLNASRDALLRLVSINRIVPGKVEKEYEEISRVVAGLRTNSEGQRQGTDAIADLRMVLHNKTHALSDLLAVLRLIPEN